MSTLFEDDASRYRVLINADGHYSLWPESIEVPAGWTVVVPPSPRREALDYVDAHWSGMRSPDPGGLH
ncbi:MbtH family protein [Burkholderia alba]|uniref:MbtH family protein n=1 Tax=Burkholderia alba TaxID=2683677 RepID=UPI002B053CF8|nr:MbtH family protein [Burkholderia alba]